MLTVTGAEVTVTVAVAEIPFNETVTVTPWSLVMVLAVPVKLTVVAPAATVADAGSVSATLLPEIVTAGPPAGAALDSVAVQLELAPGPTLAGAHRKLVTVAGAEMTVTGAVAEAPFRVAVTATSWSLVTALAVAPKLAVVAPAATVTDAGSVSAALLPEMATTDPPAGATLDKVIVQLELALAAMLAGEHCKFVRVGGTVGSVIVPPIPKTPVIVPSGKAPIALLTGNVIAVAVVDGATVTVTTATTPLPIVLPFNPLARQLTAPAVELQLRDLPAAVSAWPADRATETTLPDG